MRGSRAKYCFLLPAVALALACSERTPTAPRVLSSAPLASVGALSGGMAYVPNYGSNNVSVIRTSDNSVQATVSVGTAPWATAGLPDGSYVYVLNISSVTVSVIRTTDNTVVATLNVPYGSYGLAVTPDGNSLYVASVFHGITVIRTSDNSVVRTVDLLLDCGQPSPCFTGPSELAFTPDGSYAYVTASGSPETKVLRTSDNTVVKTVNTGHRAGHLAISPDGSHVYVLNSYIDGNISVIRTSDNTVEATVNVGVDPQHMAFGADGTYGYVTVSESDEVKTLRTSDNTVVGSVTVQDFPEGIASTADGSFLYVTGFDSDNISVIRTNDNTVIKKVGVNDRPIDIVIVPLTGDAGEVISLSSNVQSLVPDAGTATSLQGKLKTIFVAIQKGNTAAACAELQSFINEVSAQSGKKISTTDATTLIDQANALRQTLGC